MIHKPRKPLYCFNYLPEVLKSSDSSSFGRSAIELQVMAACVSN